MKMQSARMVLAELLSTKQDIPHSAAMNKVDKMSDAKVESQLNSQGYVWVAIQNRWVETN